MSQSLNICVLTLSRDENRFSAETHSHIVSANKSNQGQVNSNKIKTKEKEKIDGEVLHCLPSSASPAPSPCTFRRLSLSDLDHHRLPGSVSVVVLQRSVGCLLLRRQKTASEWVRRLQARGGEQRDALCRHGERRSVLTQPVVLLFLRHASLEQDTGPRSSEVFHVHSRL